MAKFKSKSPTSSFDSSLIDALRSGSREPVTLEFETAKQATKFRHRIHGLRAAMRRESHPDWEQLYRAGVYIDVTDPKKVIIRPRDSEFHDVLKAAGVKLTADEPPTTPETKTGDTVEDFLAGLHKVNIKDL